RGTSWQARCGTSKRKSPVHKRTGLPSSNYAIESAFRAVSHSSDVMDAFFGGQHQVSILVQDWSIDHSFQQLCKFNGAENNDLAFFRITTKVIALRFQNLF